MKSIQKISFIVSFGVLCVIYGTVAGEWQWFPYSFLDQAKDQAQAIYRSVSSESVPLGTSIHDRTGVRTPKPEEVQSGMTLITSSWKNDGGWDVGLRLIDRTGGIVHEWYIDRSDVFQGDIFRMRKPKHSDITGSYLLPNGDVLVNLTYIGLVRLDACGNVLWTLEEGTHHSIDRAEDGTFWVPGTTDGLRSTSERYPEGFPGFDGKELVLDRILNVSESGEILSDIYVLDVLYENGLERYIPKVLGGCAQRPVV